METVGYSGSQEHEIRHNYVPYKELPPVHKANRVFNQLYLYILRNWRRKVQLKLYGLASFGQWMQLFFSIGYLSMDGDIVGHI